MSAVVEFGGCVYLILTSKQVFVHASFKEFILGLGGNFHFLLLFILLFCLRSLIVSKHDAFFDFVAIH